MQPRSCASIPQRAFAELSALRELLLRLEPTDCDCPPFLSCPCGQECSETDRKHCRHCREECDCPPAEYQPPCHHVTGAVDLSDLFALSRWYAILVPDGTAANVDEARAALLRIAWPAEYTDPPRPLPDRHATSREARVDAMADRESKGLAIEHPSDRWRGRESGLGIVAARLRNGAISEEGVKRA